MYGDITELLDQALELIRSGESVEQCLARFPDHAAELAPLLFLSSTIQDDQQAALPADMEAWLHTSSADFAALSALHLQVGSDTPRLAVAASAASQVQALDHAIATLRSGSGVAAPHAANSPLDGEMAPLLAIARALHEDAAVALPAELNAWLSSGAREFAAIAELQLSQRRQVQWARVRRFVGAPQAILATLVVLLLLTVADRASALSIPGQPLHTWKLVREDVTLALAPSPSVRFNLQMRFRHERGAEVQALSENGVSISSPLMQQTMNEMLELTIDARDEALRADIYAEVQPALTDATNDSIAVIEQAVSNDDGPRPAAVAAVQEQLEQIVETLPPVASQDVAEVPTRVPPTQTPAPSLEATAVVSSPTVSVAPSSTPVTPTATSIEPSTPTNSAIVTVTTTPLATASSTATPTAAPTVSLADPSLPQPPETPTPPTTPIGLTPTAIIPTEAPSATAIGTTLPTGTSTLVPPQPTPTASPEVQPTIAPTAIPAITPTAVPTQTATSAPTSTSVPPISTATPTVPPTFTATPTVAPTFTATPTYTPTAQPTNVPTATAQPTAQPTDAPTAQPTNVPTDAPTAQPTDAPTAQPTDVPTDAPTDAPTAQPTDTATATTQPTDTATATTQPTDTATATTQPTDTATAQPTDSPAPTPTSGGVLAVSPVLECVVELPQSRLVAYFGYSNPNSFEVAISVGERNAMQPGGADQGQPTAFQPGRTPSYPNAAFSVTFTASQLIWTLDGQTATASYSSQRCDGSTRSLVSLVELVEIPTPSRSLVALERATPTPAIIQIERVR